VTTYIRFWSDRLCVPLPTTGRLFRKFDASFLQLAAPDMSCQTLTIDAGHADTRNTRILGGAREQLGIGLPNYICVQLGIPSANISSKLACEDEPERSPM
jgi:hypothetical protein